MSKWAARPSSGVSSSNWSSLAGKDPRNPEKYAAALPGRAAEQGHEGFGLPAKETMRVNRTDQVVRDLIEHDVLTAKTQRNFAYDVNKGRKKQQPGAGFIGDPARFMQRASGNDPVHAILSDEGILAASKRGQDFQRAQQVAVHGMPTQTGVVETISFSA